MKLRVAGATCGCARSQSFCCSYVLVAAVQRGRCAALHIKHHRLTLV
jgi:hypothetical protein